MPALWWSCWYPLQRDSHCLADGAALVVGIVGDPGVNARRPVPLPPLMSTDTVAAAAATQSAATTQRNRGHRRVRPAAPRPRPLVILMPRTRRDAKRSPLAAT